MTLTIVVLLHAGPFVVDCLLDDLLHVDNNITCLVRTFMMARAPAESPDVKM